MIYLMGSLMAVVTAGDSTLAVLGGLSLVGYFFGRTPDESGRKR